MPGKQTGVKGNLVVRSDSRHGAEGRQELEADTAPDEKAPDGIE